jgi:L-fucose isomerase-like protein
VRCWPEFFTELGCAACGSSSMLNDGLIPASCEADVNGAITQLILQLISGAPVVDTDIVSFDLDADTAVFWHCGKAPLSMADPDVQPRATNHSNRQKPLLMEFPPSRAA